MNSLILVLQCIAFISIAPFMYGVLDEASSYKSQYSVLNGIIEDTDELRTPVKLIVLLIMYYIKLINILGRCFTKSIRFICFK